jgi:hypothetical protein
MEVLLTRNFKEEAQNENWNIDSIIHNSKNNN